MKHEKELILPFHYPRTWFFVDDQERFLSSIGLALPRTRPYEFSSSPAEALARITGESKFSYQLASVNSSWSGGEQAQPIDAGNFTELLLKKSRYAELSVVVCDYAMPGLNGIEVLEKVDDPGVVRILLTGVADEQIALDAFNDGIIDRFVMKNDPRAWELVTEYAEELELQRQIQLQASNLELLRANHPHIFANQAFSRFFFDFREKMGCVEYFFSDDPFGFYCVDREGLPLLLVMIERDNFESRLDELRVVDSPSKIIGDLANRERFHCLFERPEISDVDFDWELNSVDVFPVPGCEGLYYGVHVTPPMMIDFDQNYRGFFDPLEEGEGRL